MKVQIRQETMAKIARVLGLPENALTTLEIDYSPQSGVGVRGEVTSDQTDGSEFDTAAAFFKLVLDDLIAQGQVKVA